MIQIHSFNYSDTTLYTQALEIRKKVFIEEQEVNRTLEVEHEEEAKYYLIVFNEVPVGTGRWRKTAKGIKLERFAILQNYRNKNLGSLLLQKVLKDLQGKNQCIYLHSQLKAVPYYQRQGFIKEGDMFTEANIQHYLMTMP